MIYGTLLSLLRLPVLVIFVLNLHQQIVDAENEYFAQPPKTVYLRPSGGLLVSGRGNFRPGFLPKSSEKVRLIDVTTLTLYRDAYTTGRRSAPIPQIQCVGGSAKGKFEPRVVQCYNRGYDGNDVQWECKAEMSNQYEFGKIRISCEGYDYPDDPYILRGSCGLKYNLEYSQEGRNNYDKGKKYQVRLHMRKIMSKFGSLTLSTVIILLLFLLLVYFSCAQSTTGDGRTRRSGWGWDQGPQPPPGGPPPPGFKSFTRPFDAPPTYEESFYGPSGSQSQSSGPGFFSGLGLGGLAGYLYGRSQNSENFRCRRPQESFWSSSHSGYRDDSPGPSTSRTTSGGSFYSLNV
ncbi:Store-operated calcium entry-associated regulatory factor [Dirofilaria immitis]|nr:Store-operated calcium entry-associated regulatory factor [Dirofilaria immitis]